MKREAVLHVPMSADAFGATEKRIVIRLRTAKNDLTMCDLFYGDTACRQNPIIFTRVKMQVVAQDELYDYYEADFDSLYPRIYYYFRLTDESEMMYYYSDFFTRELSIERSDYYKLPFNLRGQMIDIPDWVKQSVIYQIFPDSFLTTRAQKEIAYQGTIVRNKLGGTLKDIILKIPYLKNLGIGCLYLNPIFAAGAYHKYDTVDYFEIDPCLGTKKDFLELVRCLHKNGIRIVLDGVFNHCSKEFFAFQDVIHKGMDSAYYDWFYDLGNGPILQENEQGFPSYVCFAYEPNLPKLDTANPVVRDYLIGVGTYWMTEFEIDGWRLDVASELDDSFIREFCKKMRSVKSDCLLIGEIWESAQYWLDNSMFHSAMNYDLRKCCISFFAEKTFDAAEFDARVTRMRMRYRLETLNAQMNLLDSHDVSRFFSLCYENVALFCEAVLFQFFFPGVPSVFYGEERLMGGVKEEDVREAMVFSPKGALEDFYASLARFRKKYAKQCNGGYRTLLAKRDSRVYAFERFANDCHLIVILNAGEDPCQVEEHLLRGRLIFGTQPKENYLSGESYSVYEWREGEKPCQ